MSPSTTRARHQVLGIVALSLFAALFTRLWYLQVLTTEEYDVAAYNNRTRTVISEAPRGEILDRNGNTLVTNRRTIQVTVSWQAFQELDTPDQGEVLRRLAAELTRDQDRIYLGEVAANDPGAVADPDGEADAEEGDADEGEGGDEADAPDAEQAGDDEVDVASLPLDQRPPPAGVATGADNPDGRGEVERERPAPVTEEVLRTRIDDPRFDKLKPIPVATDVSEELEIYLRENAARFPTVAVERVTARSYEYGALLAHVLGYIGPVSSEDLDAFQNDEKPYENNDQIGKTGIERAMEHHLRGTPGRVVYEVDARNRPVREVAELRREPVPGDDVYLTVDINLQFLVEKGLAAEIERQTGKSSAGCETGPCEPPGGSSVVLDPRDGQVLAMASYPTYDPNLFTGGISSRDFDAIADEDLADVHHNPLLNRGIAGRYPPGSTFKLFSAYAGLATRMITPELQYNDTGVYLYSDDCEPGAEVRCSAQNAGATAYGVVDLARALTVSSDTYFYKLGNESWQQRERIGEDALQQQMRLWGLGDRTGIDLPGERAGRIPDPEWLWEYSHELNADDPEMARDAGTWRGGTSGNTVIGQGDVLATPLQIANGYAALANGGTVWKPQVVYQVNQFDSDTVVDIMAPEPIGTVPFEPSWLEAMVTGFEGVTQGEGTAAAGFDGYAHDAFPVAGKTGTAQTTRRDDTALFTAFAPSRAPTVAMATVVEFAGFGSETAVPITRRVMDALASVGGDLRRLNEPFSPYRAPEGGWFDVEAAMEEFQPTVVARAD